VLVFDPIPFSKAQAQFEHSSEVVELMLTCCLRLHLGIGGLVFGLVRAAVLSSNLVEACLNRSVSLVAGGSYESSCDTLPQPLILISSWRVVAAQHPLVVVRHSVADEYYLYMAFGGLCELLFL
jgi:hypothetical protein